MKYRASKPMAAQEKTNADLSRYRQMDDTLLRSYAGQLISENRPKELYALLLDNEAWMQAKFERFGDDESYIEDLQLAIKLTAHHKDSASILILAQLWAAYQLANARRLGDKNEQFENIFNLDAAIRIIKTAIQLNWKKECKFLLDKLTRSEMPTEQARELGSLVHDSAWAKWAWGFFEKSFDATEKIQNQKAQSEERYRLVRALIQAGDINRAYEITLTVQNSYFAGDSFQAVGKALLDKGRLDKVENLLSHHMIVYTEIALLLQLSTAFKKRGNLQKSNSYAKEALQLAERIHTDIEWLWRASTAIELARAGYINLAEKMAEKIESGPWKLTAFGGIAKSLIDDGKFDLAKTFLNKTGIGYEKANALEHLAIALVKNSQYQAAYDAAQGISFGVSQLYTLQKLREMALELKQSDFVQQLTDAINNLDGGEAALFQFKMGNLEQAKTFLKEFMQEPTAIKFYGDLQIWGLKLCLLGEKMLQVNWVNDLDEIISTASSILPRIDYGYSRKHLSEEIGDLVVKLNDFSRAFAVLYTEHPSQYLEKIMDWIPNIENAYPQIGKNIIIEFTRIFGWRSPFWQEIYTGLAPE